jgi:hypothetical protein
MELLFNELSIIPHSTDKFKANDKMKQFSETVATARQKGFRNIRSHYASNEITLAENYSLHDWLINKEVSEIYRNNLYGMIVLPFINEEDEVIEAQYVEAEYYFEDSENEIGKTACLGLTSAYLYETLSISFSSSPIWGNSKLYIIVEKAGQKATETVFNVSSQSSFNVPEIAEFIENLGTVTLIKTALEPNNKNIHLADHHGKAELKALSDQLKHSPYIVAMRSTDWGGKNFIRKVHKEGIIEIVLFKTQKQYALWVQTTGRNLRETKAIAELLDDKYA